MSQDAYDPRLSEPSIYTTKLRILGTGAGDPTEVYGADISVTWVATGRYLLTWAANPFTFAGISGWSLQATTQANVKGCTVTHGAFNTSAYTLEVDVWNASEAARDLAAAEWLTLAIDFQRLGG